MTTFTYAPHADGVAEVATVQATGLARLGHEVTVATARDSERAAENQGASVRVEEFEVSSGQVLGTALGPDIGRYREFVRRAAVDVILCHCWQCWSTDLALLELPAVRARKVLVSHGVSAHQWLRHNRFPWGLGQWWRARPYARRLPEMIRKFDHIVFLSTRVNRDRFYDHRTLAREGGPAWSVIPNGTFPERFSEPGADFRRVHGLADAFVLVYVARYCDAKNQAAALGGFLRAQLPNAALVFIGNEINDYARSVQQTYEHWPRRSPGSRVLFLERQDKAAIRAAYQAMDVFLMSSRAETQPLVILDAMACGKPFICTDVGCVSELPGGLVVRGEAQMAAAIQRLCQDVELRAGLGRAGRTACQQQYNWEKVVGEYDRLLRRLVGERAGEKHE